MSFDHYFLFNQYANLLSSLAVKALHKQLAVHMIELETFLEAEKWILYRTQTTSSTKDTSGSSRHSDQLNINNNTCLAYIQVSYIMSTLAVL